MKPAKDSDRTASVTASSRRDPGMASAHSRVSAALPTCAGSSQSQSGSIATPERTSPRNTGHLIAGVHIEEVDSLDEARLHGSDFSHKLLGWNSVLDDDGQVAFDGRELGKGDEAAFQRSQRLRQRAVTHLKNINPVSEIK